MGAARARGSGGGWAPAAAACEGTSLAELGALLNAPAPPAATKPRVLKFRIIIYLYMFKDFMIAKIWRFSGGLLRVCTVFKFFFKKSPVRL